MPSENEPTWETPARLDGLPVTNWKKRTGYSMSGTVATCIERWLGLALYNMREASLGWGPCPLGDYGHMDSDQIGAFVIRHGIPPKMADRRGGQPEPERLAAMVSLETPWRPAPPETDQLWGYTFLGSKIKKGEDR